MHRDGPHAMVLKQLVTLHFEYFVFTFFPVLISEIIRELWALFEALICSILKIIAYYTQSCTRSFVNIAVVYYRTKQKEIGWVVLLNRQNFFLIALIETKHQCIILLFLRVHMMDGQIDRCPDKTDGQMDIQTFECSCSLSLTLPIESMVIIC